MQKFLGYSIGGKTGTSEDGVNTGKYVTSFVGIAPIKDPSLVILITLYNPTGEGGHQGGGVAAPIAGQILSEVLPYLEIKKSEETETLNNFTVLIYVYSFFRNLFRNNRIICHRFFIFYLNFKII